ncbi:uncharacterized protein LOC115921233 [Strongylocentrotus purpuratus]|uniref:Uncharacterized protein n=1 Tax=Strongylocentrotus purpuratus TaxID=7668 RepID=A0A7M7SVJ9_STRPU|nr:uncharacterized protein LOC115921233 [Strongylocentrotus purpuratus]
MVQNILASENLTEHPSIQASENPTKHFNIRASEKPTEHPSIRASEKPTHLDKMDPILETTEIIVKAMLIRGDCYKMEVDKILDVGAIEQINVKAERIVQLTEHIEMKLKYLSNEVKELRAEMKQMKPQK